MPLSKMPPVKYSITRMGGGQTRQGVSYPGGLDLVTPTLSLPPGSLRAAQNFEVTQTGGYARIEGYERYDGKQAPSSATFRIVPYAAFVNVPVVGSLLVQDVTGAQGKIVAVQQIVGSTHVAITQAIGSFDTVNMTKVGAVDIGIPDPILMPLPNKQAAQYTAKAADVYRALINPVPGSGKILDVFHLIVGNTDAVFALRANAAGTAVNLYQASITGWLQVPLGSSVSFTASTQLPLDGDTLTQGAVSATIKRVQWQSGAAADASAAGSLILSNIVGGSFAAGAATSSSGGAVTLSGAATPITIAPGGRYEHDKYNFNAASGQQKVYGVDGVNPAFEFDGTTYVPIHTGAVPDKPRHVTCHKSYLVLSTLGSIMGSAPNAPYKWQALDGSWEIATGSTVTGMVTVPGAQTTATLAIFHQENTSFLYGTDRTTFNYVSFNTGIGALEGSVQNLFDVFVFDALGVITVQTTLNFGNFASSSLTKNILPFILEQRKKVVTSSVQHTKGQYRVFFSDGQALYLTMVNQQYLGAIPIAFPNTVNCIDASNQRDGSEKTYFGAADTQGYVYQLDVGTSFDGHDIPAFIVLAWDALNSPRVKKRYRAVSIELQGNAYAEFMYGYNLSYVLDYTAQPSSVMLTSRFAGTAFWDSFTWDNFIWDGQTIAPTDIDIGGTAENIQSSILVGTNYIPTFTIDSLIYHYTSRRGMRV